MPIHNEPKSAAISVRVEFLKTLKPCLPDRVRTTRGSKGEWKDPDTLSCAMPHQGILTTNLRAQVLRSFA
jgi:hypothetical protein